MVAYLKVRSGPDTGRRFRLDPLHTLHVGRDANCEIMLTDPVSSRYHAVLFHEDSHWQVRDTNSRNGLLVNGQKTDHATLQDSNTILVGTSELQFFDGHGDSADSNNREQTIVLDRPISGGLSSSNFGPLDPLRKIADVGYLVDLYQLSLQLIGSGDPDSVIQIATELLKDRTQADVIGFMWLGEDGKLQPEYVFPSDAAEKIKLSSELTRRVTNGGEAFWFKEESTSPGQKTQWTDAICVPLQHGEEVAGVLHLYRNDHRFNERHFELALNSGQLLGVALSRARRTAALQVERDRLFTRNAETNNLIGESPPMMRLKSKIERVGKANGCVLIRGESGAGKELVARDVHQHSGRRERPLLSVNCAAIPRDLIESQLFGHKKGSFTGADRDHIGWFQQAHTGTLFLDEIGELTLEGQAKLLRIMEGHPFLPVGGVDEIRVDVRIIAATNRDLAEFVREKRFREDLYYRLSVFELHVPPLRDRGQDIELLMNHFLEHFSRQHARPSIQFSEAAKKRMLSYAWPGNVRQLRNVIDSAIVMFDGNTIEADDLGLRDAGVEVTDTLRLDVWEEKLIREALDRCNGSIPEAAKRLGISRATAYRKIADFDIEK
ncbi:Nitrogen fixation protein VnfA [Rosistilla carotiformis]|uniref:Nitrogen fixation protein VnfA n=1 Tax=Rosistilla carotiformis TaxID=2528017 RepID=A0A518JXR0_9BACT|nr:sigma 54-interacting transcriptional regulator [Rosistilla carotiformis]QDV70321.1 Nitrogen fixation protein VnfA [Rosistilla carotiformis]